MTNKVSKILGVVVAFAFAVAVAVPAASALSRADVELLISLGIIPADKAADALAAFGGSMTGSTSAACGPFTRDLTVGSTGADVVNLQTALESWGHLVIPAGVSKGNFGPLTKSALARYQSAEGISPAVGYFGPITRANVATKCGSVPSDDDANDDVSDDDSSDDDDSSGDLSGGAGDITVTERSSGVEDEVLEGEEDIEVLGFEVEAEGSDVAVTSVRVEFEHDGSGSDKLDRYVDTVSIVVDGEVVGSADVDEFNEDSDEYSRNIPVDVVVNEDETTRFYVAVSAGGNIDSDDLEQDWEVALGSIRFEDATGAILSDTTGTGVNGSITETFTFEDLSTSGDIDLRVSETDDEANDPHSVAVDDSDDTDNVDLLNFSLDAEGSDIFVNTIVIDVTSNSGTGVTEIANDFTLEMDGEEVGTVTIDKDCDGGSDGFASSSDEAICVVVSDLDDDDVMIEEDGEASFVLIADINDVETGFATGDDLSANIAGQAIASDEDGLDAEDENGDALTDSTISGSADSTTIEFLSSGIAVTTVSTDADSDEVVSTTATDDIGIFTIIFDVEAIEDDAYIELGTATRGTTESNTGANFVIQDNANSYTATTTGTIPLADLTRVSGGSTTGNFVKIPAGQTAQFQLEVTFNPAHVTATSEGYRMYLYSVNSAATAVDATAQQILTPEADYRTGSVSVGN